MPRDQSRREGDALCRDQARALGHLPLQEPQRGLGDSGNIGNRILIVYRI